MASTTLSILAREHPIKSVTVFRVKASKDSNFGQDNNATQKAEVTRTFTVDLQAGQNEVNITGLSGRIDTRSVRVSGLGDNASLFDVMCTVGEGTNTTSSDGSETLRLLRAKKSILEDQRHVREREAELLMNYGKTLQGDHVTPIQMTAFLDSFLERGVKNSEAKSDLTERIAEVDRQIQEEMKKASSRVGQANSQVTVVIASEAGGPAELTLTYIVSHAAWEPVYDLFATTDKGAPMPSVGLDYRARIWQSTGEDWNNTKLVLSTATSDSVSDGVPDLDALKIKVVLGPGQALFGQPRQVAPADRYRVQGPAPPATTLFGPTQSFGSTTGALFGGAAPSAPRTFGAAPAPAPFGRAAASSERPDSEDDPEVGFVDVPEPAPISEPATTVSVSPFSTLYKVDRSATIPSDGKAHQVLIACLTFDAGVSRIAVPRKKPVAYLKCRVKNTSDYRLLPGSVRVFFDKGYVSTAYIGDVNAGDSFDCLLGMDTSIHLSYRRSSSTVKETRNAFSEQFKITTYSVETVIRNKHRSSISELVVRDAVPHRSATSAGLGENVKIVLREPAALADAKPGEVKEVGDKGLKVRWVGMGDQMEGEYVWECKLDANEEIKFTVKYEIKAPADFALHETVISK
ncbi:hypothetical protein OE88DRAFT_1652769 [Heliocybe sulcata]|uniref:DUF4139 domain-containing protein n=1 Tax=Heliocybe sulcata TaxID=5364 RepID=A0A5C3NFL6_9AGAM|nr:hypothetical protein OE88DRAFT_1652769 [Heliocybe sulcata]